MSVPNMSSAPLFSVGLTGGIGSGKSTVAELFARMGVSVIDTDDIGRLLTAPGGRAIEEIRSCFGDRFIDEDGALDRARMRELVFTDNDARKKLEKILHPLIRQEALSQAGMSSSEYVIFVIPLLTEKSVWRKDLKRILVIDCPEELQIERVMKRSNLTRGQVEAIMSTQLTRPERLSMADDVIVNDGDVSFLSNEVSRFHAIYEKIAAEMRL